MLCCMALLAGCGVATNHPTGGKDMKTLQIRWQRLVDEQGQTCDRCGSTQEELQQALKSLKASLRPLGIRVALVENPLAPEECAKDISQSNRIWVGDRPLEEWLGAEVGMSLCGTCCSQLGDEVECRTVVVDGKTFEAIPAELIIKGGLLGAAQLLGCEPGGACCPAEGSAPKSKSCCPSTSNGKE